MVRAGLTLVLCAVGCTGGSISAPEADPRLGARPASHVDVDPAPDRATLASPCTPGVPVCDQADAMGFGVVGPVHGRGAAMVDVDGDGWDDLWQAIDRPPDLPGAPSSTLFRNRQDGTFEVLDLGIDPSAMLTNWGSAFADIDNDGDEDMFMWSGGFTTDRRVRLYRNDLDTTGSFTDISVASGLTREAHYWWGASFGDFDADGFVDLVLVARNEGPDAKFPSTRGPTLLYHNEGDGTFLDVTRYAGIETLRGDAKNPVWLDLDDDGWLDLYLASNTAPAFYRNDGGRRFVKEATPFGIRKIAPVFAAAAADFDQDGIDDLYLGRALEQDYIVLGSRTGDYEVWGPDEGLSNERRDTNTMGLGVGDLTTDGHPDVMIGPGAPNRAKELQIFCSDPASRSFQTCSQPSRLEGRRVSRFHGVALGDVDRDGDNDMFWNLGGSPNYDRATRTDSRDLGAMYVNHAPVPNTVTIHLVGTISNRSAVGAKVTVLGSTTRYLRVRSAAGFQSQNSRYLVANLGTASVADVVVDWPSGERTVTTVPAGARVTITE